MNHFKVAATLKAASKIFKSLIAALVIETVKLQAALNIERLCFYVQRCCQVLEATLKNRFYVQRGLPFDRFYVQRGNQALEDF